VVTDGNSENGRRMEASSAEKCGYGEKEDVSSTGRVWAAGFHHVTVCSRLALLEIYDPFIS
jgi:hypothetical protein